MSEPITVKIQVTGSKRSGKTTLLKELQKWFNVTYRWVEVNQLSLDEKGEYLNVVIK
jgi:nicotinamide riboside kinase